MQISNCAFFLKHIFQGTKYIDIKSFDLMFFILESAVELNNFKTVLSINIQYSEIKASQIWF